MITIPNRNPNLKLNLYKNLNLSLDLIRNSVVSRIGKEGEGFLAVLAAQAAAVKVSEGCCTRCLVRCGRYASNAWREVRGTGRGTGTCLTKHINGERWGRQAGTRGLRGGRGGGGAEEGEGEGGRGERSESSSGTTIIPF